MKNKFDFPRLIEQLDDEAFNYCRKLIYPICDFKYITLDQIRKVDLEERSLYLRREYDHALQFDFKPKDECLEFVESFKLYFKNYISQSNDKRILDYINRANAIVDDMMESSSFPDEKIESVIMVYVSVFRTFMAIRDSVKHTFYTVKNCDFTLEKTDDAVLEMIRVTDAITPEEFIPKKLREKYYTSKLGWLYNFDLDRIHTHKNYFHFIASLYLSHALQELGAFSQEESV